MILDSPIVIDCVEITVNELGYICDVIELCPRLCHEFGLRENQVVHAIFSTISMWLSIRLTSPMKNTYYTGYVHGKDKSPDTITKTELTVLLKASIKVRLTIASTAVIFQSGIGLGKIDKWLMLNQLQIVETITISIQRDNVKNAERIVSELNALPQELLFAVYRDMFVYKGKQFNIDLFNSSLLGEVTDVCFYKTHETYSTLIDFSEPVGLISGYNDTRFVFKLVNTGNEVPQNVIVTNIVDNMDKGSRLFYKREHDLLLKGVTCRNNEPLFKVILITGPSGVGKTTFVEHYISTNSIVSTSVYGHDLLAPGPVLETLMRLDAIFSSIDPPTIIGKPTQTALIIDQVDQFLCSGRPSNRDGAMDGAIQLYFESHITRLRKKYSKLSNDSQLQENRNRTGLLFLIVEDSANVPYFLFENSHIDMHIELGTPTHIVREEILAYFCRQLTTKSSPSLIKDVSLITHGYLIADLYKLSLEAFYNAYAKYEPNNNANLSLEMKDFIKAKDLVHPSILNEHLTKIEKIPFGNIYGLTDQIKLIQKSILTPLKYVNESVLTNTKLSKGLMLYGPPGMGKTMIAKAIAYESSLNLIAINDSTIRSKILGESEKRLKAIFSTARQAAPCILLLENIDMIARTRTNRLNLKNNITSSTSNQSDDRLLSTLLTLMDGIDASFQNILVIGTTNHLHLVDNAILRPGRIDTHINIAPSGTNTVHGFIDNMLAHYPNSIPQNTITSNIKPALEAKSYADINSIFREAALIALHRDISANEILDIDIITALKTIDVPNFDST